MDYDGIRMTGCGKMGWIMMGGDDWMREDGSCMKQVEEDRGEDDAWIKTSIGRYGGKRMYGGPIMMVEMTASVGDSYTFCTAQEAKTSLLIKLK